ncbi:hypothetical protein LTR08_002551 [Meristemomyces frigidus]|nr:hypothetical protein LTR08_002551 [Meristemomyces frigidus]
MSVTTTDNARITSVRHYLADYDHHYSQPTEEESAPAPAPNAHPPPSDAPANSPPGWQDRWRRVPAYRPTNHQLDEQRDTYNSAVEHNFIRVMFSGVFTISMVGHLWRATGGKLNSEIMKYKIGGEW